MTLNGSLPLCISFPVFLVCSFVSVGPSQCVRLCVFSLVYIGRLVLLFLRIFIGSSLPLLASANPPKRSISLAIFYKKWKELTITFKRKWKSSWLAAPNHAFLYYLVRQIRAQEGKIEQVSRIWGTRANLALNGVGDAEKGKHDLKVKGRNLRRERKRVLRG